MKAENYKISKLSYIENGRNEIMERYQIHTKYETEPPHGDAIYSISIKGKVLPFWIYGRVCKMQNMESHRIHHY